MATTQTGESDNSDGWDEEFSMGDPLFEDTTDNPDEGKEKISQQVPDGCSDAQAKEDAGRDHDTMLSLMELKQKNAIGSAPDIVDLPAPPPDNSKSTAESEQPTLETSCDQNQAPEIASSSQQVNVGTETKDLIATITRSSSTDESHFGPPDVHPTAAMITSISTVSDGSEEERFVKVKPGDFEFESSKGSSQSGKDNLESEEHITLLSSQCDNLRSELAEKESSYLAVKLQLESMLLEKSVEGDALDKSSQQISNLKEELSAKDEELNSIRQTIEESGNFLTDFGIELPKQGSSSEVRNLAQLIGNILHSFHQLMRPPQMPSIQESSAGTKPDLINEAGQVQQLAAYPVAAEPFQEAAELLAPAIQMQKPQRSRTTSTHDTTDAEIKNLKELLDEKSRHIDVLTTRCSELEASLSFAQNELSELRNPRLEPLLETSTGAFATVELDRETPDCIPTVDMSNINLEELLGEKAIYAKPITKHIRELEERLLTMEKELNELTERESDVIGGYQSVSASLEKVQLEYAELQKELSEKQGEITILQERIKNEETTKLQTHHEVSRFKEELLSKDEDLMELENNLVELRESSQQKENDLNKKMMALENELMELKDMSSQIVQPSVNQSTEVHEELLTSRSETKDLQSTAEELSTARKQFQELKEKYDKLEEKFKKAVVALKQRNAQLAEAKENESRNSPQLPVTDHAQSDQLSGLQAVVASLEENLIEKETTLDELQKLLTDTQDNYNQSKLKMEQEMFTQKKELDSMREMLNEFEQSTTEKSTDIEQLMKHTEELQALINRQNHDLSSAIAVKDEEIRRIMQQYEDYYQQNQEQINQLNYSLMAKVDEMTSLKEEFTELEKELSAAQSKVGELKNLLQNSEQSHHRLHSSLQECQSALDEKKLEVQLSIEERDILQAKLGDLILENKKKTANIDQLDEALSLKIESVNLLEFNVNECKATIAEYSQQISELREKLQSLLEDLAESQRREEESAAYKESYRELVQVKKENNHLQLQLADSENRFQHMITEYERQTTETELLKDAEVLGTRNELNQMKGERDDLLKDLQQIRERISMLENENANLATSAEVSHTTLAELSSKLQFAENEVNQKCRLIESLQNEVGQLTATTTQLQSAYHESLRKVEDMAHEISQLKSIPSTSGNAAIISSAGQPILPDEIKRLLEEEKSGRETMERKIELLQGKIHEVEVSEMKSFEECLMLKSWMREVELENIKYAEELRGFQAASAWEGENPKVKTLQNEILRMVQSLEERDKRSTHLTMEITRLLEERDGLQLKLSSVLRQNVTLNEKMNAGQSTAESPGHEGPDNEKEQLEKKLAQLEEMNYSLDVDLKRAKEARRLVQEQLLLTQTSKFYRERSQGAPRVVSHIPYSTPPVYPLHSEAPPITPITVEPGVSATTSTTQHTQDATH